MDQTAFNDLDEDTISFTFNDVQVDGKKMDLKKLGLKLDKGLS